MIRDIFDTWGAPILLGAFITFFLLETILPLRRRVQRRWKRIMINFVVSLPAFALLRILFIPFMVWLASEMQALGIGLNHLYKAPWFVEGIIAFLLLDYSNYLWHIILHKMPLMWRFHLVHHTDLDLDLTTALRFHFGEMIGSVFFRGAAIALIGASPLVVLIYEIMFELATEFHHSNLRLPVRLERLFNRIVVTPRMHGIHHSVVERQRDSNFSIIFSWWDRLHKTMLLHIPQEKIIIGVPTYLDEKELTIGYLLKLPFTRIRNRNESRLIHSPDKEIIEE